MESLTGMPNILVEEPLGYIEFLSLVSKSQFVLTDSGSIQDETCHLGIPCVVISDQTERRRNIDKGRTRLIQPVDINLELLGSLQPRDDGMAPLWDGRASERAATV